MELEILTEEKIEKRGRYTLAICQVYWPFMTQNGWMFRLRYYEAIAKDGYFELTREACEEAGRQCLNQLAKSKKRKVANTH